MTMTDRVVCVAVDAAGDVGHSWGKAPVVAIATVAQGGIRSWELHEVAWDVSHDAGPHGSHHARIVRFLRENEVTDVVVDHVGDPMRNTLQKLGVHLHEGRSRSARVACEETDPD